VPRLDKEQKKMVKCDLCQDEKIPVCVANCPNEALVYAEVEEEKSPADTCNILAK
jgi:Fe-S-cluster-containing hydrogenase component 2